MIGIHRLMVQTDGKMLHKLWAELPRRVVVVGAIGGSIGVVEVRNA